MSKLFNVLELNVLDFCQVKHHRYSVEENSHKSAMQCLLYLASRSRLREHFDCDNLGCPKAISCRGMHVLAVAGMLKVQCVVGVIVRVN